MEFPDLEGCQAEGPDLEDAVENARDAAYNWLMVEIEEETYEFPSQTHVEDMGSAPGRFCQADSGDCQADAGQRLEQIGERRDRVQTAASF